MHGRVYILMNVYVFINSQIQYSAFAQVYLNQRALNAIKQPPWS